MNQMYSPVGNKNVESLLKWLNVMKETGAIKRVRSIQETDSVLKHEYVKLPQTLSTVDLVSEAPSG